MATSGIGQELVPLDIGILIIYFVVVLSVGLGSMCRSNRGSAEGYFLAGGSMIWLPIGASLFASNIGSEHFVGLAGSGAASGIAVGAFELNALFILQILGWLFLPVYLASGIYTMPEYIERRFGGVRLGMLIAFISLVLYIFTKISVDLYSGALFIEQALGWNLYGSIGVLLAITAVYTVTGGLAAVIYTDTVQTIIMLGGAIWLCAASFIEIGGYSNLEPLYGEAVPNETKYGNNSCGEPRDDYFHMLRDPVGSDLPWPGFFFGQTTASIWYIVTDQVMVQRTLAARNLSHGKGATLFAGYCKIAPLFAIVMPGMISRILFPDIVACVDNCEEICGSKDGCSNLAYPIMVMNILPDGVRGLMLAVMMSAIMSSLTSIFNSGSSIFTMDIWRHLRKFPHEQDMLMLSKEKRRKFELELMIVGRIFVLILVAVSILWIPVVQSSQNGKLFDYIQQVSAYMAPSIAAIFVLAVFWKRINEKGAFWGMVSALVIGAIRMILDFIYPQPRCGEPDTRPEVAAALMFHYMYFALFLFLWTVLVATGISLLTDPVEKEYLYRLTFWTRFSREHRKDMSMVAMSKGGETPVGRDIPLTGIESDGSEVNGNQPQNYIVPNPTDNDETPKEKNSSDEYQVSFVGEQTAASYAGINETERANEREPAPGLEDGKPVLSHRNLIQHGEEEQNEEESYFQRSYHWFCGFSSHDPAITDEDLKMREQDQMEKVIQKKRDVIILNVACACLLGIGTFLYAWYA